MLATSARYTSNPLLHRWTRCPVVEVVCQLLWVQGSHAKHPQQRAPSTSITDTATPGDTADATGAADVQQGDQTSPDAPGATETPKAGDTPDAPDAVDGGNTQQGDQSTPDA